MVKWQLDRDSSDLCVSPEEACLKRKVGEGRIQRGDPNSLSKHRRSSGLGRNLDHLRARESWGRLGMFALQEILLRAFQQRSDMT